MEVEDAEMDGAPDEQYGIRSIFFYNAEVEIGEVIQLHFFEPRYRLMIKRAMEEPCACRAASPSPRNLRRRP